MHADVQLIWSGFSKEHHRGAIQMAQEEQKSGENAAVIALAKQIAQTQTAEISLINRLIAQS